MNISQEASTHSALTSCVALGRYFSSPDLSFLLCKTGARIRPSRAWSKAPSK